MHIAIIGAGAGGLCSARHALAYNFQVTVFELNKVIGGTWVYTDQIGTDEYGLNVESSMYQDLRTNGPKEVMGFPDWLMTDEKDSFPTSECVLKTLNNYAKHFQLFDHIKLEHYVIRVHPKDDKWEIIVKDLKKSEIKTIIFDAVMVCNGHHGQPNIPDYEGRKLFEGEQMHCHSYRQAEEFRGHDLLIVGLGFSGMDVIFAAEKTAKSITISSHAELDLKKMCPDTVDIAPDVAKLTKNGVEFVNGVHKNFTKIIYCTGYLYSFPFLSMHCNINVDDNYVYPLYKHCFNIERPTMILLGLFVRDLPMITMDMQARMFMKYLKGEITLPSKDEMLRETEEKMKALWDKGRKKRHSHWFFDMEMSEYFDELVDLGKIEKPKSVVLKIFYKNMNTIIENFSTFRNCTYAVLDDENYLVVKQSN